MTNSQFLWATAQEVFYKVAGWQEYEDDKRIHHLRWLRWQTYILKVNLDLKQLHSPMSLFTLPEEDELYSGGAPITAEQYEAKLERFEQEAHVFDKWDLEMKERYADTSGA